jgi:hypothetical protein
MAVRNGRLVAINPEKTGINIISSLDEMSLYDTIMTITPDRKIEHIALAIIRNPSGQPSMAPRGSSFVGMKTIMNIDIKMKRSIPMMPDAMIFVAILYVLFKIPYAPGI